MTTLVAGLTWLLTGAGCQQDPASQTSGATRIALPSRTAPDFESPGDSGRNNVYEVTVKVTDSEGNTDEQDVTVKVTNVEEARNGHPVDAAAEGWFPGDGHAWLTRTT